MRTAAVLLTLAMIMGKTDPVASQQIAQAESKGKVEQTVVSFLAELGALDVDALEKRLHPKMSLLVVRKTDEGMKTSVSDRRNWLASLRGASTPFVERIGSPIITIDGGTLAHVRAEFTVEREGRILSHGVDHFTLVQEGGVWLIANIAYTSIPGPPA
ncbi:MAG: hypothetical protein HOH43_03750 [Candidatus Latescibacteria bacterium]|nr:hypothetical protein [Candidatus Latescibacterota bacterium]